METALISSHNLNLASYILEIVFLICFPKQRSCSRKHANMQPIIRFTELSE